MRRAQEQPGTEIYHLGDAPFAFSHVPRTGGTSLIAELDSIFPASRICPAHEFTDFENEPEDRLKDYAFYRGHVGPADFRRYAGRPVRCITFLRDPIERLVSLYRYNRRLPLPPEIARRRKLDPEDSTVGIDEKGRWSAQRYSLDGYLSYWSEAPAFFSPVTPLLALGLTVQNGLDGEEFAKLYGEGLTSQALDELNACAFAGITDLFAESLALLRHRMGWPQSGALHLNHSESATESSLSPAIRRRIEPSVAHDRALYQHARDAVVAGAKAFSRRQIQVSYRKSFVSAHTPRDRIAYRAEDGLLGSGWWPIAIDTADGGYYRWSRAEATLDLPLVADRASTVIVELGGYATEQAFHDLEVRLNGLPVFIEARGRLEGKLFVLGEAPAEAFRVSPGLARFEFRVRETAQIDGLAVGIALKGLRAGHDAETMALAADIRSAAVDPGVWASVSGDIPADTPVFIGARHGYNVVAYGGKFYAVPQSAGHFDLALTDPMSIPGALGADSRAGVYRKMRRRRDAEADPNDFGTARLTGHIEGYNVIALWGLLFAVPQAAGDLDLTATDPRTLPDVLSAESEDELRDAVVAHIRSVAETQVEPRLLYDREGFNIVQVRGRYFAIPWSSGTGDLTAIDPRTLAGVLWADTRDQLERRLDGHLRVLVQAPRPPRLLGVQGQFNLVLARGAYLAIPQSAGAIDLENTDLAGVEGVIAAATESELRNALDRVFTAEGEAQARTPRRLGAHGAFNLVALKNRVFAIPLAAGPLDLTEMDPTTVPGVIVAHGEAEARAEIDRHSLFDFTESGGRVFAIPRAAGPIDATRTDPRRLPGVMWARTNDELRQDVDGFFIAARARAEAARAAWPRHIATFATYNLVRVGDRFYGCPRGLTVDFRSDDPDSIPGMLVAETAGAVTELIAAAEALLEPAGGGSRAAPRLLQTLEGHNIQASGGWVLVVPHSLGAIDFAHTDVASLPGVLREPSLEAALAGLDALNAPAPGCAAE